jgi:cytochrome c-type biogenesis protein
MSEGSDLGMTVAFAAGVVSFLSPCVLPLVPAYVSYVAGQPLSAVQHKMPVGERLAALFLAAFFVLGFSAVFMALGASATALGGLLLRYRYEANIIAGSVVILFGVLMLGAMRFLPAFYRDVRFHPRIAASNPVAAFILGLAFGFGWTPCIGPVLGAILTVSAVQSSVADSAGLLAAYAAGLGLPFLVSALFLRELVGRLKILRQAGRPLQVLAGAILIALGLAMVTGKLTAFSYWLLEMFPALGRIG